MRASKLLLSLVLGFGLVVLSVGMLRGKTPVNAFFQLRESRDVLVASNSDLANENHKLKDEIRKIEQSASYAKRLLKDKYHIIEPGEKIVFFAD